MFLCIRQMHAFGSILLSTMKRQQRGPWQQRNGWISNLIKVIFEWVS